MKNGSEPTKTSSDVKEHQKRRREVLWTLPLVLVFLAMTWIELRLFDFSQSLPFAHSIFFIGLVNFNIILFLLIMFLIFRNIVKVFVEKRRGLVGSTLKSKLILAFSAFSFFPTALMFLVSVFYINNSFDKWFSEKMAGVLKGSMEVTNAFHLSAKKRNYHFAYQISKQLENVQSDIEIKKVLSTSLRSFALDAVEYFPAVLGERVVVVSMDQGLPSIPAPSVEFLKKSVEQSLDASMIHHLEDGNLIRVVVPVTMRGGSGGAVVV